MTRSGRSSLHSTPPSLLSAVLALLVNGLLLTLLLASVLRFSITTYLLPVGSMPVMGVCLLAGMGSTLVWSLPRYRWLAVLFLLAAGGALFFYYRSPLIYGGMANLEALTTLLTDNTDFPWHYVLSDPLPSPQHQEAARAFLWAVTALLALPLGWTITRLRSFWLAFVLTLPWLMPAFLAEVALDWPALMLLCALWGALLLSSLSARTNPGGGARVALLALPFCLVVIWGVCTLFPREGYTQPAWAVDARDQLLALDWFSSEEGWLGPILPDEGGVSAAAAPWMDLSSAGPRRYTGRGVFQVESTHPGSMYLRGMIYQDYTGDAWAGQDPVSVESLTHSGDSSGQGAAHATITHLFAPSTVVYVPYQTTQVGDVSVPRDPALFFPSVQEEYSVSYVPLEGEPAPRNSLTSYDLDRADAYENYLSVPEDTAAFLGQWYRQAMQELKDSGAASAGDFTGTYAQELNSAAQIAQLLARNAQYDLNTPYTPADEDFVTYFLGESHRGYCVHFASAAALLLRLEGIPTRYVSGYATFLPAGSAQSSSTYSVRVLDSNAHAWVEIYLDGYGWYPVEVTPSAPASEEPGQEATPTPTPTPTPAPSLPPSSQPESSQGPDATAEPEEVLTPQGENVSLQWLPWAILILALLSSPCVLRGLRRRSWQKMCRNPDGNAAVLAAYGWFQQLGRWGGKAGAETEALVRKARFSQHTLTTQERDQVLLQLYSEILRVEQSLPAPRRLLLRLLFPVSPVRWKDEESG